MPCIPSWMVPAPQVSVRPYPCRTGQRKQMFMKRWVFSDRGAPPLSIILTLPPSTRDTLEKMYLSGKIKEKIFTIYIGSAYKNLITNTLNSLHFIISDTKYTYSSFLVLYKVKEILKSTYVLSSLSNTVKRGNSEQAYHEFRLTAMLITPIIIEMHY